MTFFKDHRTKKVVNINPNWEGHSTHLDAPGWTPPKPYGTGDGDRGGSSLPKPPKGKKIDYPKTYDAK